MVCLEKKIGCRRHWSGMKHQGLPPGGGASCVLGDWECGMPGRPIIHISMIFIDMFFQWFGSKRIATCIMQQAVCGELCLFAYVVPFSSVENDKGRMSSSFRRFLYLSGKQLQEQKNKKTHRKPLFSDAKQWLPGVVPPVLCFMTAGRHHWLVWCLEDPCFPRWEAVGTAEQSETGRQLDAQKASGEGGEHVWKI